MGIKFIKTVRRFLKIGDYLKERTFSQKLEINKN